MTNKEFIANNIDKFIYFKPKTGRKTRGMPVGEHFVITSGYTIYNAHLRVPLIPQKFLNVQDSYDFCLKLIEIYGDFLYILEDERYAKHVFRITRYSVPQGLKIEETIRSFETPIRRADLVLILDN